MGLAWLAWTRWHTDGGATTPSIATVARDGQSAPTPPAALTTDKPGRQPLPPLRQPLRMVLPELRRRADAGEAVAACRLAAELEYCAGMRERLAADAYQLRLQQRLDADSATATVSREERERLANARQEQLRHGEQLLRESAHCADVSLPGPGERIRYWRQGALAGHPAALRHYLAGNAFGANETLDNLDALAVYRREAEDLAWKAAANGDIAVQLALATAYVQERPPGPQPWLVQAIKPDEIRALALHLQLRRQMQGMSVPDFLATPIAARQAELESRLAPADIAAARQLAADYWNRWPRPRTLPTLWFQPNGGIGPVRRHDCR